MTVQVSGVKRPWQFPAPKGEKGEEPEKFAYVDGR